MGCLFEFIFEIIFEGMIEGCVALMQWIIPKKTLSKKTYRVLKVLVIIFACVLFMSIFIGIFALISDDNPYEVEIGKRMVFIPLAIIVVQILIGVIVRMVKKKKQIYEGAKELQEYYSQFPDWYWKFSIHDAQILAIKELDITENWDGNEEFYNCLEIKLDSSNASYERNIEKIYLYNYKIKTDIQIKSIEECWWMGDILTHEKNRKYLLDITVKDDKQNEITFEIVFEKAKVVRK